MSILDRFRLDGRVALVENTGKLADRLPQFLPPVYFQQEPELVKFGALVTPVDVKSTESATNIPREEFIKLISAKLH